MKIKEECGFFTVITQDRIDDLRRFLVSLKRHNSQPVQVIVVNRPIECFRYKSLSALLSPFEYTITIDTDIYVNGSLEHLFSIARKGKIGIYHEKKYPAYNCGVMAIPKGIGEKLCPEWNGLFERGLREPPKNDAERYYKQIDQGYFNEIAHKYPIENLSQEYNYILKEHTPEEERKDFHKVKIFHFLHGKLDLRQYLSYRTWMNLIKGDT